MKTTEDILIEQIAAMQKRMDEHDAQLLKLFSISGASWEARQRQARSDQELRAHESAMAAGGHR
jgi:hypothetical protein